VRNHPEMELHQENVLAKWTVPECPFTIEYSPRVLDDIRLAVTDAFFSLPRGGAEIGGLLLGRQEKGRIAILDSMPMECEHAFGPSFVLSDRDQAKLAGLVSAAGKNPHVKPLGWWHSHTRSEIFLSEADLQIHSSFFPERWQVALVLKPHTFQAMRGGFFFREPDGSIHATESYQEIVLDAMPMRPAGAPEIPRLSPFAGRSPDAGGRVVNVEGFAAPDVPMAEPEPELRPEVAAPNFLSSAAEPRESRRWIGWVAAAFGVTLAIVGYSTRDRWMPTFSSKLQPTPIEAIALNTLDDRGQLQIRWNDAAPPVRSAHGGSLLILDGSSTVNVPLDVAHVQSGGYTFRRRSARVDVTLVLEQGAGKEVRVATLFSGDAPAAKQSAAAPAATAPAGEDPKVREERDKLRQQNAGLTAELARQMERNKLLEKSMEELRKVIDRDQQRKRLEAQNAGK
jgi:proteasome lid subunit RPN8/RPN11